MSKNEVPMTALARKRAMDAAKLEKAQQERREGRRGIDLAGVKVEKRTVRKLAEIVASLPHTDLMQISYWKRQSDHVIVPEDIVHLSDEAQDLIGKTVGSVRRTVHQLTDSFSPYIRDAMARELEKGFFVINKSDSKKGYVKLDKPPTVAITKVTEEDAFAARLTACCTDAKTRTELVTSKDKSQQLVQATAIEVVCKPELPENDVADQLLDPIVMIDDTGEDMYLPWEGLEKYLADSPQVCTGLGHLYWCYKEGGLSGTFVSNDLSKYPTWTFFYSKIREWPSDKSLISKLMLHSVWHEGAPVPSVIGLANVINMHNWNSVVGDISSKVIRSLKNCYISSQNSGSPDPASETKVQPVDASDYKNIEAQVFFHPNSEHYLKRKFKVAMVSITTPTHMAEHASLFATDEGAYHCWVVYGNNPHIIMAEGGTLNRAQLIEVAERLALSATWIPYFNLAQMRRGRYDVWAVCQGYPHVKGAKIFRTNSLDTFVYQSMARTAGYGINRADWTTSELECDDTEADALIAPEEESRRGKKRTKRPDEMDDDSEDFASATEEHTDQYDEEDDDVDME